MTTILQREGNGVRQDPLENIQGNALKMTTESILQDTAMLIEMEMLMVMMSKLNVFIQNFIMIFFIIFYCKVISALNFSPFLRNLTLHDTTSAIYIYKDHIYMLKL